MMKPIVLLIFLLPVSLPAQKTPSAENANPPPAWLQEFHGVTLPVEGVIPGNELYLKDFERLERTKDHLISLCDGWEPAIHEECVKAYSEYYRTETSLYAQRRASFDFELASAKMILAAVLLLVLSGLIFAALQFWHAIYGVPAVGPAREGVNGGADTLGTLPQPTAADSVQNDLSSDLEISLTGFKLKSSILGLLLVVVSMGFFYLYIRYVYPIQVVNSSRESVEQPHAK
jgi:hypothetical protein